MSGISRVMEVTDDARSAALLLADFAVLLPLGRPTRALAAAEGLSPNSSASLEADGARALRAVRLGR